MKIVRAVSEMRQALAPHRTATVGLVPTMGAFHDGHLTLVRTSRRECDVVVVSLFVNPTQFNEANDLALYPRDEARDVALARNAGVDYLFAPDAGEMYSPNHVTWVEPTGAARGLEGDARPGHFRGVATVCLKLFLIVQPQLAYFGQKDAQQVAVVTEMVRDLNVDVRIRTLPTVRDVDGLALSSRNTRLSADDRRLAIAIPRALEAGLAARRTGGDPVSAARAVLGGLDTEYVALAEFDGHPTLAIAARVSGTRLIDNVRLDQEPGQRVSLAGESAHGR